MTLDFGGILKRAFQITKNNRSLWLFGILMAILNSGGNIGGRFNYSPNMDSSKFTVPKIDPQTLLLVIVIAVILGILLFLIAIFVNFLARGALIEMVDAIDKGGSVSVREGFKSGLSYLFSLFSISFLLGVSFFFAVVISGGILIVPGALLLIAKKTVIGIILLVLGGLIWLALLIAGSVLVSVVTFFAEREKVLEDLGVIESIKQGYALFRQNLGDSLVLWLINLGIGIVSGIIVLIIVLVTGLPVYLLAIALSKWLFILLIFPFAIIVFVSGLFETFFSTFWTIAYNELSS